MRTLRSVRVSITPDCKLKHGSQVGEVALAKFKEKLDRLLPQVNPAFTIHLDVLVEYDK